MIHTGKVLKTLGKLTPKIKVFLGIISTACVSFLLGALYLKPRVDSSTQLNAQLETYVEKLEAKVTVLSSSSANFENARNFQDKLIEELRADNQELQERLISLQEDLERYRQTLAANERTTVKQG